MTFLCFSVLNVLLGWIIKYVFLIAWCVLLFRVKTSANPKMRAQTSGWGGELMREAARGWRRGSKVRSQSFASHCQTAGSALYSEASSSAAGLIPPLFSVSGGGAADSDFEAAAQQQGQNHGTNTICVCISFRGKCSFMQVQSCFSCTVGIFLNLLKSFTYPQSFTLLHSAGGGFPVHFPQQVQEVSPGERQQQRGKDELQFVAQTTLERCPELVRLCVSSTPLRCVPPSTWCVSCIASSRRWDPAGTKPAGSLRAAWAVKVSFCCWGVCPSLLLSAAPVSSRNKQKDLEAQPRKWKKKCSIFLGSWRRKRLLSQSISAWFCCCRRSRCTIRLLRFRMTHTRLKLLIWSVSLPHFSVGFQRHCRLFPLLS